MIELVSKYELAIGKVLSVIEIEIEQYKQWNKKFPFYKNIRKEGICLWKRI